MHQFNAEVMFARNNTQAFIDTVIDGIGHTYLMRKARQRDSSGLEAKRRKEQVEFDLRVAQAKRDKDAEKRKQALEAHRNFLDIPLITSLTQIPKFKVKELDHHLDMLQQFGQDTDIPKLKKDRGLKENKQVLLCKAFKSYEERLKNGGETVMLAIQRALSRLESEAAPENEAAIDGWEEADAALDI